MTTHNLLTQSTSFIGRQDELTEITGLLQTPECRLLTLAGPGGIGKTRLAIETACSLPDDFTNGIAFVALQPLTAIDHIVPAVAEAVNFQFFAELEPEQALFNYLREKKMLLVLDNFEHLLTGADLLTRILAAAPDLQILVTSREVLRLQQEWIYDVRGMSFPVDAQTDRLGAYSAVRLFAERARQTQRYFKLEDNWSDVVRICKVVEGLPLGIELAASRMRVMSCQRLAAELEKSLDLLTNRQRTPDTRHESLQAVFEHSWGLLDTAEQKTLMRLSVFNGGFTGEAAQTVTGAAFDRLASLVDKSLVRINTNDRYDLHAAVSQFAAKKLEAHPQDKTATRDRHCATYTAFLANREARITSGCQHEVLVEIDNLRAAWEWAVAKRRLAAIQTMAYPLFRAYWMQDWLQEGQELFGRAAEALHMAVPSGEQGIAYGVILNILGSFHLEYGRWNEDEPGLQMMRQGLAILRKLDTPPGLIARAFRMNVGHGATRDTAEAERFTQECRAIAQTRGEDWLIALALNSMGDHYLTRGDFTLARPCFQEALAIARVADNRLEIALALYQLGMIDSRTGNQASAQQYLEDSLVYFREMDIRFLVMRSLWEMGFLACQQGNFGVAEQHYQEGLAIVKELGSTGLISHCLCGLTMTAWQQGHHDTARQLGEEFLTIRRGLPMPEGLIGGLVMTGYFAAERGATDKSGHDLHEALTIAQVKKMTFATREILVGFATLTAHTGQPVYAVQLLGLACSIPWDSWSGRERWPLYDGIHDDLTAELSPDVFATAWERGQQLDLTKTIDKLLVQYAPTDGRHQWPGQTGIIEPLTRRELEVLRLLAEGYSNADIADNLHVVLGTVKTHVYNIYQKLDTRNRTQTVARARELRLL
ncbi:tetratricopeptide repeat protein [Chloroflexota bacterium]